MKPTKTIPTIVFADGACSGNPGPGGWGVVIATPDGKIRELGGGAKDTTNNRMELAATIRGLSDLEGTAGEVAVYTDSVYVIRGITQWCWAWRSRDWKTAEGGEVANPDLWKNLIAVVAQRGKLNPISWHYVRGHSGIPGNERVDAIAVAFSRGERIALYSGSLLQYDVAIHDIPEDTSVPEPRPAAAKKEKAYSYLSVVNGVPMRHTTWPECEARVKGRPGAKFKKAMNEHNEGEILKSWGISPDKLAK